MDNKELLQSISKRLGVLIALKIEEMSDSKAIAARVEMLTRFGLPSADIAEILNTSVNTVNVTRTRLKKKK